MSRMDFNQARKQAFVDEEPVEVNEGTTAQQLLEQQGYSPSNRSVTVVDSQGNSRMLGDQERIKPEEGQFQTNVTPTGGK